MTISSRTPDGTPRRCHVCGSAITTTPSYPTNDAPCPACGTLLFFGTPSHSAARYSPFRDSVRFPLFYLFDSPSPEVARAKWLPRIHPALTPVGIFLWMSLMGLSIDALVHFIDPMSIPLRYSPTWSMLCVSVIFAGFSRWGPDHVDRLQSGSAIKKWLSMSMFAAALIIFSVAIGSFGWKNFFWAWIFALGLAMVLPLILLGFISIAAQIVVLGRQQFLRLRSAR